MLAGQSFRRLIDEVARWALLGWYDFVLSYRRTILGPLWQIVQVVVWSAGLALVFGPLHEDEPLYVPYLVVGMTVWNLLSGALTRGAAVFVSSSGLILNVPVRLILHVVRLWSNLVVRFVLQAVVFIPLLFWFQLAYEVRVLEALIAVLVLCAILFPTILVLGYVGVYFRDFEHVVAVGMRFLFFLTPVFWMPQAGQIQAVFIKFNPLYYPLEMVRRPLLGNEVGVDVWLAVVAIFCSISAISWMVHKKFAGKVSTWL